jgi:hypothetical protein
MAAMLLLTGSCSTGSSASVPTYSMGSKVQLGHISYTVFETQYLTQIPQEPTPRIPTHRFLLIRMRAENTGAADVLVPALSIEDDSGATYNELSNGEGVNGWIGYIRRIKAGQSLQGVALFDAPPKQYKLHVADETAEKSAVIEIPLSFGAEAPPVEIPESKK